MRSIASTFASLRVLGDDTKLLGPLLAILWKFPASLGEMVCYRRFEQQREVGARLLLVTVRVKSQEDFFLGLDRRSLSHYL